MAQDFAAAVIRWQRSHGRHGLPWQGGCDPYRVWLSEVMLQQTQVQTVLAYYARFTARFADVRALAAAPLDDVLALWSGLGYYGRARNLHRCAQAVVELHGGEFPRTSAGLAALPGIGRSTAAAIAAFCFGERVAILDGNVKRVLARVLAFDGDLAETRAERALWNAATSLLPEDGIAPYTQGLMDLGATVCLPRAPLCLLCPVQSCCAAAATGTQTRYPVKTKKLRRGSRESVWLDLRRGDALWLVQRPPSGIWAGLWSWPEFDSMDALVDATAGWPGTAEAQPAFVHVLTHLDWRLQPVRWSLPAAAADGAGHVGHVGHEEQDVLLGAAWPTGRWFSRAEALALGLPSPLRKRLVADAAALVDVAVDGAASAMAGGSASGRR